jgi:S-adenosylmethionine hydrolase
MKRNPLITLTTDFGLEDPFAGVMKGVILSINPAANIVDLSHGIESHNIREAAFFVGTNYNYFPHRTAHVVVVDPGVGSRRRPILVVTENHYFIGPDNGVFSYVYEKEKAMLRVYHITADHYFLKAKSSTFQGRDLFAPVAAWLTGGKDPENFGTAITDYETIYLPVPALADSSVTGEVLHIDKFGNSISNISRAVIDDLLNTNTGGTLQVFLGSREVPLLEYYGQSSDKGLCAIINSSEYLELFVNQGSAAKDFAISKGDPVALKVGG